MRLSEHDATPYASLRFGAGLLLSFKKEQVADELHSVFQFLPLTVHPSPLIYFQRSGEPIPAPMLTDKNLVAKISVAAKSLNSPKRRPTMRSEQLSAVKYCTQHRTHR